MGLSAKLRYGVGPRYLAGPTSTAFTVTMTSSVPVSCESLAASLKTYLPAALKLAPVWAVFGLAKVTFPGPLTLLDVLLQIRSSRKTVVGRSSAQVDAARDSRSLIGAGIGHRRKVQGDTRAVAAGQIQAVARKVGTD